MGKLAKAGATPEQVDRYRALLRRIDEKKPSAADLRELEEMFVDFPNEVRDTLGIAAAARKQLIYKATDPGIAREAFVLETEALIAQLGRDKADPLEALLIEHVASTFLLYSITEFKYSGSMLSGDQSIAVGEFWEMRLTNAQKRYMRALDALARYRRLPMPELHLHASDLHLHQPPAHVQSRSED